jgi:hypothetical protein
MNDIDKNEVGKELSEKYGEKVDIAGFYDGMSKSDRDKLEGMVNSCMGYEPESADIDHIEIRFDEWSIPKVTIWTKGGSKALDIEENRSFENSFHVNGRSQSCLLDIRPF